jgi:D-lactate dehydrogenase (cytochrome)
MERILTVEQSIDKMFLLRCEAGVTLDTIHSFLKDPHAYKETIPGADLLDKGYLFAPDPTEKSAQIGGMAAVNASGARSFRFGAIRNHIVGCKIVITNGDLLSLTRGQYLMGSNGCDLITERGDFIHVPTLTYKNPEIKNAAGYYSRPHMDILDLFIGSEGTLGAIVEVTISLVKSPSIIAGLSFFPTRDCAFGFVDTLRNHSATISLEYFDPSALLFINRYHDKFSDRLPPFPEGMTTGILWEWDNNMVPFERYIDTFDSHLNNFKSSLELTWSPSHNSEKDFLKEFRHALPEAVNCAVAKNKLNNSKLHKIGTDTAVPCTSFYNNFYTTLQLIESTGIPFVIFGHIGDCHLHINFLPEDEPQRIKSMELYEELMKKAVEAGGTISAEHGIGKIKRKYLPLMYNREALDQMKAVKAVFDPNGMFNTGNLL